MTAPDTPKMIFVNLPVADLARSMAFYEAIGFTNEPRFTDDTAAAMVWSETIFVMILTHDKWKSFTDRPIAETTPVVTAVLSSSFGRSASLISPYTEYAVSSA